MKAQYQFFQFGSRLAFGSFIALATVMSGCASMDCDFHLGTFLVDEAKTEREYLVLHQLERSPLGFDEPLAIRIEQDSLERTYSNGKVTSNYTMESCRDNQLQMQSIEYGGVRGGYDRDGKS